MHEDDDGLEDRYCPELDDNRAPWDGELSPFDERDDGDEEE